MGTMPAITHLQAGQQLELLGGDLLIHGHHPALPATRPLGWLRCRRERWSAGPMRADRGGLQPVAVAGIRRADGVLTHCPTSSVPIDCVTGFDI
jgi:hypothetical protein